MCCDNKPSLLVYSTIMTLSAGYLVFLAVRSEEFKNGDTVLYVALGVHSIHLFAHLALLVGVLADSRGMISVYRWYLLGHMLCCLLIIGLKVAVGKRYRRGKGPYRSRRNDESSWRFWGKRSHTLTLGNFPGLLAHMHKAAAANAAVDTDTEHPAVRYFNLLFDDVTLLIIDMIIYNRIGVYIDSIPTERKE